MPADSLANIWMQIHHGSVSGVDSANGSSDDYKQEVVRSQCKQNVPNRSRNRGAALFELILIEQEL